jgi:membrane associated rhomboid family serine protease
VEAPVAGEAPDVAVRFQARDGRKRRLMLPVENAVASRTQPVITWALIAVNCAVFLVEEGLDPVELERFLFRFALVPARAYQPHLFGDAASAPEVYLTFVTNMFLHGGWLHLILNMWTLWVFGPAVEDRFGPGRYLGFYLACGVLASATHAAFHPTSIVPALGASGAISGVLGAHVRLFPFARLVVAVPIIFVPIFFEMPASVFAGLWFLMQVLQGTVGLFLPALAGGIAWWAHIGGFVAGLALVDLLQRPRRRHRPYYADEGVLGFHPSGHR